ncbi:BAR domain-containing protein [Kitasatospora griseola]|uniref:hypothetical protein n=1 Tax=Kitasatospora griseola TaxID=2064 RepID=UPI00365075FF
MTAPTDDHLAVLLDRACRGVATPAEGEQLRAAVAGLQQQLAHARRTAGGLQAKVQQQATQLRHAEQRAARYRAAWQSARRRARAEFDDDDWPDSDTRRYMLRRGRWVPIDDCPPIDDYQPQENSRARATRADRALHQQLATGLH